MIVKEKIEINGRTFQKSYSDSGVMIEREGRLYYEAIDPFGHFEREYTETNIQIIEETEDI